MILYVLKQNKNRKSPAFGKYFAYPVIEETIDLDALAEHMSNHNTPYSKGAIKGMLTDMVSCIKELLLEGKNVKIADLAIFSLGIKNNGGAVSEDVFTVSKNIKGVKLRARATGELIAKSLNLEATLKAVEALRRAVTVTAVDRRARAETDLHRAVVSRRTVEPTAEPMAVRRTEAQVATADLVATLAVTAAHRAAPSRVRRATTDWSSTSTVTALRP